MKRELRSLRYRDFSVTFSDTNNIRATFSMAFIVQPFLFYVLLSNNRRIRAKENTIWGNELLHIKIMRAVALTCMEFKGHLIIKVDVCKEVRQAQASFDIFILRMRIAREEACKVNTDASDWYAVSIICSHKSVINMANTRMFYAWYSRQFWGFLSFSAEILYNIIADYSCF